MKGAFRKDISFAGIINNGEVEIFVINESPYEIQKLRLYKLKETIKSKIAEIDDIGSNKYKVIASLKEVKDCVFKAEMDFKIRGRAIYIFNIDFNECVSLIPLINRFGFII